MSLAGKQVLFISYNGMLEPLGQSQVIPYLKQLSKLGAQFTLLSYERAQAFAGEGPLVIPGVYTLRMNVDGQILTQTVTVKNDPGSRATAADLAALHNLQMKLYDGTRESWDGFQQIALSPHLADRSQIRPHLSTEVTHRMAGGAGSLWAVENLLSSPDVTILHFRQQFIYVRALFRGIYLFGEHVRNYDVAPDGRRFLMVRAEPPSSSNHVSVLKDWRTLVRR